MLTTVQLGRVRYEFDINSKFTILRGDSGVGKTTLFSLLDKDAAQGRKINSPYEFLPLRKLGKNMSWDQFFESAQDDTVVFYADEDFGELYTYEFQKAMGRSNLKFLIAVRDLLSFIPYGIKDVYTVRREGMLHKLVPVYEFTPLRDLSSFNMLVTEDKKSGFFFFFSFLRSVDHADGKGNIVGEWRKRNKTLFIVDGVGFGSEIGKVIEASEEVGTNGLWVIDSFEALVLKSDFISDMQGPSEFERNKEQFYESRLKEVMGLEGQVYTKRSPCECLLFDCCYKSGCGLSYKGTKAQIILGDTFDRLSVFGFRDNAERVQVVKQLQMQQSALQDTD